MTYYDEQEHFVITSLKKGERQAFAFIYAKYYDKLCQYIYTLSGEVKQAEDVVHDTFISLWENRRKLKTDGSLKAYLYKSSYNCFIDVCRKTSRNNSLADSLRQKAVIELEFAEKGLKEQRLELLHRIINKLPEKRKDIFILYKLKNYRYKEIAAMRNISERTVESQIRKALISIRKEVTQLQLNNIVSLLLLFFFK